jgi:alpha,alpha-trehalase
MKYSQIQTEGALFEAVQLSGLFADSKTFPDAIALNPPEEIEASFRALLEKFVSENFQLPADPPPAEIPEAASLAEYIDSLWNLLKRPPDPKASIHSSLIPLPHPYVVPGGRFREIYYWDSYFTCEGLAACGRMDLVEAMIANFAYLIGKYGHVPNGNRTYYLSRSQPPFFWKMLQLLEREKGFESIRAYLPSLEKEYRYWMEQAVHVDNETGLNRYWDERNAPRDESYREDVGIFQRAAPEKQGEIYRNIRAAAESGWDFSSRWLSNGQTLESIRTTDILPVDLNCLLYGKEQQLSKWFGRLNLARADEFARAAERRKTAILKYCWSESQGWFFDYSWRESSPTDVWSLAGMYALYCGIANEGQAQRVAENAAAKFLRPGGVVTTLNETGQQWDAPNGWAPLQWITVQGLLNYNQPCLATEIAKRFVALVEKVYTSTGKLMEKYNVCDLDLDAGGGEYPLQDGFGWTNGVVKRFLEMR